MEQVFAVYLDDDHGKAALYGPYPDHKTALSLHGGCEVTLTCSGVSPNYKPVHDSDCAMHREPAYPAGPCDCSLSK